MSESAKLTGGSALLALVDLAGVSIATFRSQQRRIPMMSISGATRHSAESPTLAKVLTAASLSLGATELLAPTLVSNVSGVAPTRRVRNVIRALGVRELAHGFALSVSPASAWTRVAGDVLDIALLAVGHRTQSTNEKRGLIAAGLLTGVAGLDVLATRRYVGAA